MKHKMKNRGARRKAGMARQRPGVKRLFNELQEGDQVIIVPADGGEPIILDPDELASEVNAELDPDDGADPDEGATAPELPEGVPEITINGDIGCWPNTSAEINALLSWINDADPILVSINSGGGDVFEAFAIYNTLLGRTGHVTVRINGLAASAASLISMAGDHVIMPENSMMMIHEMGSEIFGSAEELRSAADMMDNMSDFVIAAYAEKSGLPEDELLALMETETWLSAEDAVSYGFADEIEEAVRMTAATDAKLLARFKNVPAKLRAQIASGRPVTAAKDRSRTAPQNTRKQKPGARTQPARGNSVAVRGKGNAGVIASICRAAGVSQHADRYASMGLDPEVVRRIVAKQRRSDAGPINNRARPVPKDGASPKGINSAEVYAKRAVKRS